MKNTLHQTYTVSSFQVDPRGKARLTTLANFLQETAYKHADSLQLGYRQLAGNNSARPHQVKEQPASSNNSMQEGDPVPQKMYISGHNLNTGRECFHAVITFHPSLCAQ